MNDLDNHLTELHEVGFQILEAKKYGQREVTLDDYEHLLNIHIEVFRYLKDLKENYDKVSEAYLYLYSEIEKLTNVSTPKEMTLNETQKPKKNWLLNLLGIKK